MPLPEGPAAQARIACFVCEAGVILVWRRAGRKKGRHGADPFHRRSRREGARAMPVRLNPKKISR
jgi:hypothetical protein